MWVIKNMPPEEGQPIATLSNKFKFNAAAKRLIVAEFIMIGAMESNLVIAPCKDSNPECYKMQTKRGAFTIGGDRLPRKLQEFGLEEGRYLLTEDSKNGWWVGEKIKTEVMQSE
jgi:hypothetical protein